MKLKHLAVLLALSTIAADCPFGDSTSPGTDGASVAGTYALQKLNGNNLPAPWNDNGISRTVTSGTVVINANGTFTYAETNNSFTDNTSGTWTKNGDVYTFVPQSDGGDTTNGTGTFSGTQFTLTIPDGASPSVRIYQKQ